MNRLVFYSLVLVELVLWILFLHAIGGATTCTVPNSFTNGTTADANQVNANFSSLQACGNNIDHTNVGAAGIYASQIIPTSTAQATFGGAVGYVFNPGVTSVVPVTISNAASPTVDYFDVKTSGGTLQFAVDKSANIVGTTTTSIFFGQATGNGQIGTPTATVVKGVTCAIFGIASENTAWEACVDGSGDVGINGALTQGARDITISTANGTNATLDATGTNALFFNFTGGSGGVSFCNGAGGCNATVTSSGGGTFTGLVDTGLTTLRCLRSDGSDNIMVANSDCTPVYNASGTAIIGPHDIIATCVFSSSQTCTVTLTGNSIYSSQTSYACSADWGNIGVGTTVNAPAVENNSGSSFTISTGNGGSTSGTVTVLCKGS